MSYLFLGQDSRAKDQKIAEIKAALVPTADSKNFDCDHFYAQGLDSEALKKSLVALPILAKQRLVVIRQAHKFSTHNKDLIKTFLTKPYSPTVLILDSDEWTGEEVFIKDIAGAVQVMRFGEKALLSVFDLTRAIGARQPSEALNVLSQILAQGDYPLQLMGGLLWHWKQMRGKIPLSAFHQGLLALQEADVNIKRSRLPAEDALEVLVVKLSSW